MAKRELIFNEELTPLYGDFIEIPANTLFWRGYDTMFDAVSDKPAYYSSKKIAYSYSQKDGARLGSFMNSHSLRLIDVRYLKVILRQLLDDIKVKMEYETTSKNSNKTKLTADDIDIMHITASFGVCSLHHQIIILKQLFQERTKSMDSFKNLVAYYNQESYPIVEQQGFRIGETEIDAHTMFFLQHFFSEFADGFISPRLLSPYHIEKNGTMSPEMIIFNPKASGIIEAPTSKEVLEKCQVEYLISKNRPHIILESGNFKTSIYGPKETESKKGGSLITHEHPLNILERKIIEKDPKILTLCRMGISCAKRWGKNRVKLFQSELPVPSTPLSIFKK
jgi:hypothetical protein